MRLSTTTKIYYLCVFPSFILGFFAQWALTGLTSFIELWVACIAILGIGLIIDLILIYIVRNGLVVMFDVSGIDDGGVDILAEKFKNHIENALDCVVEQDDKQTRK